MLKAELKVVGGTHDGKVIALTEKFLIGREDDCQLRPNSELVSRHHCVFALDEYGLRLRDLGSTNGTFVNGEQLHGQTALKAGDRVRVGKLDFEILLREAGTDAPGSEVEAPPSAVSMDTTELSSSETSFELPVIHASDEQDGSSEAVGGDTTIIASQLPAADSAPGQPSAPQPEQPTPLPQQPLGQYPQQPAAAYPSQQPAAAYPPQLPATAYPLQQPAGAYPPPPAGQFPQPPVAYPQQPAQFPMYPQQPVVYPPQQPAMYPQQPAPLPQQPSTAPEQNGGNVPSMPVHLPPPETTGAAPAPPPDQAAQDENEGEQRGDQSPGEEKNPSEKAADIIRQFMQRRPEV